MKDDTDAFCLSVGMIWEGQTQTSEIDVASAGADGITSAFGIIHFIHFLGIQVFIFKQARA